MGLRMKPPEPLDERGRFLKLFAPGPGYRRPVKKIRAGKGLPGKRRRHPFTAQGKIGENSPDEVPPAPPPISQAVPPTTSPAAVPPDIRTDPFRNQPTTGSTFGTTTSTKINRPGFWNRV